MFCMALSFWLSGDRTERPSGSHLVLIPAHYVSYGVKYIGLESVASTAPSARDSHLDFIRAPYVLYRVKFIGLVSLAPFLARVQTLTIL